MSRRPPKPSEEQAAICDAIHGDEAPHVVVNACAGSGKTTTVFYVAERNPGKRILLITYSASLKEETRERVDRAARSGNCVQIEAQSIHSLGCAYFDAELCQRDEGLKLVARGDVPLRKRPVFDFVVIDELQDVAGDYFRFLVYFLRVGFRGPTFPQLLLLGDVRQAIRAYADADVRYLSLAEAVWPWRTARPWRHLTLRQTFRLPRNVVMFINECMRAEGEMEMVAASTREAPPVRYYVGNPWLSAAAMGHEISRRIAAGTLMPEEVFVLAPSLKALQAQDTAAKPSPLQRLEHALQEGGVPVYWPPRDDGAQPKNARTMANKLVFSTWASSKGLERRLVVVLGFSADYFKFFGKEERQDVCVPVIHVAVTRAKEELWLLGEAVKGEHLPFLKRDRVNALRRARWPGSHEPVVKVLATAEFGQPPKKPPPPPPLGQKRVTVTRALSHLPDTLLSEWRRALSTRQISAPSRTPAATTEVPSEWGYEGVADLNGLALPAMREAASAGDGLCTMRRQLNALFAGLAAEDAIVVPHAARDAGQRRLAALPAKATTAADFLALAVVYKAVTSGLLFPLTQIPLKCEWLADDVVQATLADLRAHVPDAAAYEVPLQRTLAMPGTADVVAVEGIADAIADDRLVEIKCVKTLEAAHFLQLALYAWMARRTPDTAHIAKFVLVNALSGEAWTITSDVEILEGIVVAVLRRALQNRTLDADEGVFVQSNAAVADREYADYTRADSEDGDGAPMDDYDGGSDDGCMDGAAAPTAPLGRIVRSPSVDVSASEREDEQDDDSDYSASDDDAPSSEEEEAQTKRARF